MAESAWLSRLKYDAPPTQSESELHNEKSPSPTALARAQAEADMDEALGEFYKHYTKSGLARQPGSRAVAQPPTSPPKTPTQPKTPTRQTARSPLHDVRVSAEAEVSMAMSALEESFGLNSGDSTLGSLDSISGLTSDAEVQYLLATAAPSVSPPKVRTLPWADRKDDSPVSRERFIAEVEADLALQDVEQSSNTPSPRMQYSILAAEARASPELRMLKSDIETLKSDVSMEKYSKDLQDAEVAELEYNTKIVDEEITTLERQVDELRNELAGIPVIDNNLTSAIEGSLETSRLTGEVAALKDSCTQKQAQVSQLTQQYEEWAKESRALEDRAHKWKTEAEEAQKNLDYWEKKGKEIQAALDQEVTKRFEIQKDLGHAAAEVVCLNERIERMSKEEEPRRKADEQAVADFQAESDKLIEEAQNKLDRLQDELEYTRQENQEDADKQRHRKRRNEEIMDSFRQDMEDATKKMVAEQKTTASLKETYKIEVQVKLDALDSLKRLMATARKNLEEARREETRLSQRKRTVEKRLAEFDKIQVKDPVKMQAELELSVKKTAEGNTKIEVMKQQIEEGKAKAKVARDKMEINEAICDENVIEAENKVKATKDKYAEWHKLLDDKARRQRNTIKHHVAERKQIRNSIPGVESTTLTLLPLVAMAGEYIDSKQDERKKEDEERRTKKEAELAALRAKYEEEAREEAKKKAEEEGIPWEDIDPDRKDDEGKEGQEEKQEGKEGEGNAVEKTEELPSTEQDLNQATVQAPPTAQPQDEGNTANQSTTQEAPTQETPTTEGSATLPADTTEPPPPAAEGEKGDAPAAEEQPDEEKKESQLDQIKKVEEDLQDEKDKQGADLQAKLAAKKAKKEAAKKKLAEGNK